MKDQYFGDINDYRKYGLLRIIIRASQLPVIVAWMLTPDDGSTDGKFTAYLDHPDRWSRYDPELFQALTRMKLSESKRQVISIEVSDVLPQVRYFRLQVPDGPFERAIWLEELIQKAKEAEMVFLDPDNGLEVKSKPYGTKNSSKFLYWREVQRLWASGKSLLIYQHFIRENRLRYLGRVLDDLKSSTPGSIVEAFSTPNVAFLMALQPKHHHHHSPIVESLSLNWRSQFQSHVLKGDVQHQQVKPPKDQQALAAVEEGNTERGSAELVSIVRRFWREVWNEGKAEVLEEIIAPGGRENGEIIDVAAFQKGIRSWRGKFPDFSASIEELIPLGEDRVVSRVTYRGTHREQWAGLPATGRTFECLGIDIFRLQNGKITELWHSSDHLDMAFQLGAMLTLKEPIGSLSQSEP